MELDLDSFLQSHGGDLFSCSSDDDDSPSAASRRRRTIDEILNDTDSDSDSNSNSDSTSSPSKPPPLPLSESKPETLERSTPQEPIPETVEASRAGPRDLISSASLSSLGIRSLSTSSRQFPPLFTGVRLNPKPGAALSAAAAASRSNPSPHAAAIKSRRAVSSSSLHSQHPAVDLDSPGLFLGDQSNASSEVDGDDGCMPSSVEAISQQFHGEQASWEDDVSCSVEQSMEEDPGKLGDQEDENAVEVDDELLQKDRSFTAPDLMGDDNNTVEEIPDSKTEDYAMETSHDGEVGGIGEELEIGIETNSLVKEKLAELESSNKAEKKLHGSEIDRLAEEKLAELESSKKAEKKLRASMKPLEWAEELEKKQASSGVHWEEGAAMQPMRLEGIRSGPPAVGYLQMDLDNAITRSISSQDFKRDHGSPQVLAVHMNFIAMGTSKGTVLLVPSKYSTHSADNMDAKMSLFGSHGEKSQAPVTSMCFNQQGDLLLIGYGDGHLIVWDVQRAMGAKVINGEHSAPVVHTLFLGHDSQITRQFKAVTGDSKGLVLLHTFSVPLLNRFSIKTQCLLDGKKTGTVLSACPLLMDGVGSSSAQGNLAVSASGLGSMVGGVVGGVVGGESGWKLFSEGSSLVEGVVVFVTHQNALVVRSLLMIMENYKSVSIQMFLIIRIFLNLMRFEKGLCLTLHGNVRYTQMTPL